MNYLPPKYRKLTESIAELIEMHSMVSFIPVSANDPERLAFVLAHIDQTTQYGEDEEVQIRDFDPPEDLFAEQ